MTDQVRALSLTQPWATLVALGVKRIETRSWGTTYRGPILIHAAKSLAGVGGVRGLHSFMVERCDIEDILIDRRGDIHGGDPESSDYHRILPRGVIVAVAQLVSVDVMTEGWIATQGQVGPGELPLGFYAPGRRAWILDAVRPLAEPVVCNGQQLGGGRVTAQGLWTPPADVVDQALEQARGAGAGAA